MKQITLPDGDRVPALGQGTWRMGEDPARRAQELASIRHGIDLGLTLIDTAEMYGDGRSEMRVGEAIQGRRDDVFIVTKVYPHHASRNEMQRACHGSLQRLGVDVIDLYLLHWPGRIPLDETMQAFTDLQREGKIRHWGVSNFDLELMQALQDIAGGSAVQTNQVLYNLSHRGIEWDLLPWLRERRIPVIAYSPFDEGRLLRNRPLVDFAKRNRMTASQACIAWLLAQDDVIAIPKTGDRERMVENAAAVDQPLTPEQLHELDTLFRSPKGPVPLDVI
ncbi:MAG TPA: aldo/keto reductase [Burkholderiaceae bacterium]|nr:aldo/keto reductase [Burkholderiaceae bacterium]